MRTALVLEIEELLFDTLEMRAQALHRALDMEGVQLPPADVRHAHAGVAVSIALARLSERTKLDDLGRELVLRRVSDIVTDALARHTPSFDPAVRNTIEDLASAFPIAVVTRASRTEAQQLLERAGLDGVVSTIQSLAELDPTAHHTAWTAAWTKTHSARGVAFARGEQLCGAAQAGLRTVSMGPVSDAPSHAHLESLALVDAAFIASLF